MGEGNLMMTNPKKLLSSLSYLALTYTLALTSDVYANQYDNKITAMSQDIKMTTEGKTLFNQVCASCHSKDLSGATGFNLKDGEWIHGRQPSQIIKNIKNGFASAGMPGFAGVYSEPQLESIVAYILSKREGFDGLTYKLYQMNTSEDKEVTPSKLIKQGELPTNLVNLQLPEVEHYLIEFEGDFYAPKMKTHGY